MDFELSEEHKLIRKTARKFAEEVIRPAAKHHDETCEYPYEIIEEAKKLDLIAPAIPEQYGARGWTSSRPSSSSKSCSAVIRGSPWRSRPASLAAI
jgi:alkylation response protein AidB-like acyl-CoA dehydrogenase